MIEKVYPCLRESDSLDMRLKQMNSFKNSFQILKKL